MHWRYLRAGVEPYERCNLLATLHRPNLWYRQSLFYWIMDGSDTDGSRAHLYQEVNKRTGQVIWLDTESLCVSIKKRILNFDYGGRPRCHVA